MKIGAVTLAYNDEGTIRGTLRCLKPFVDTHIVMLSEKPYFGAETAPDNTEGICQEEGVDVVKGTWNLDNFQRNAGNQILSDCDWLLTFDSDEMMLADDVKKLIQFLHTTEYDAVTMLPEIYWRTIDYRLRPKPSYTPPIAMRPTVRFTHIRNINTPWIQWDGGELHHLSWCAPKDIYKKVTCYAHAPEFDGRMWYYTHYEDWTPGTAVLPTGEYDTVFMPLPKELQLCLKPAVQKK